MVFLVFDPMDQWNVNGMTMECPGVVANWSLVVVVCWLCVFCLFFYARCCCVRTIPLFYAGFVQHS